MTRAASWSIKGVGFDARQAAEEAARRAGMSVGDWMNEVIAEQAAEMGVDVEDFGDDDRLEAVAGRLSRMSGRDDDENRRWREKRGRDRQGDERGGRRPRRARRDEARDEEGFAPRRPAARGLRSAEAERLLESAVDAFERRAARASSRTAAALATVADRLGDLEARLEDQGDDGREAADVEIRESLDRLEHRMESLARRAARPEREPADAGLRDHVDGALRDIGARLDHVMARLDRPQQRDPRIDGQIDATLRDLGARLDHVVSRLDRPRVAQRDPAQDKAIEAIERKLAAVLEAVNRAPRPEPAPPRAPASRPVSSFVPAAPAAPAPVAARPRVGRAPVSDLVAEIERRQRDLDEPARSARRPAAPAPAPTSAAISPEQLDARLDQFAERFERVAQDAAARAAQEAAARAAQEAAARAEAERRAAAARAEDAAREAAARAAAKVAQDAALLAAQDAAVRAVQEAAARAPAPQIEPMMRGLQSEVGRLAERMEEMRKAAARPAATVGAQEIEDVRREIAAVARSMHDLDARQPLAQLERAVRDLGRRVEASRAEGAPEAVTAPLANLAAEMRDMLSALDPRPGFAAIERALQDVVRRFDGATGRSGGVDASELAALRAQNAEIRSLLDDALRRPAPIDRVERQIAALGDRLDRLAFAPAHVGPPEIAQAIGEIRAMMSAAVPSGSVDALEGRVAALSEQIARLGEARAEEPAVSHVVAEQLDRRLGALAEKMDRLGAAPGDAPRLASALDEIRALVGSAAPVGAVKALERQIEGLAGRLDRLIAVDPANEGLSETLAEIRALMSAGAGAKARENQALERQIAGLADRLDRFASEREGGAASFALSSAGSDGASAALSEAMRELRQMMAGGDSAIHALERRVADLADRIGAAPASPAHDVGLIADEVARRVRGGEEPPASGVTPQQEQTLRLLLSDISERVSEIRRPGFQDETLNALRSEVGRLAERLDRAEDGSADVSALSGAVAGLMDRLDQIRDGASQTAQEAARVALREAMTQGLSPDAASSEEIEALKARQGEAERRSNATLGAVHDTLEKIVDRLAQLEDEVDLRPVAQAPAPAPRAAALARAVPDDGFADEPLGVGQTRQLPQAGVRAARSAPSAVPSAVSALAEDLLIDPSEGRGPAASDPPERRDAAAFIAAARRMTQQTAVETPEPASGIAARAASAAQAARAAILAKTGKGDVGKAETSKAAEAGKNEAVAKLAAKAKARAQLDDDEPPAIDEPETRRASLQGLAARKRPILIGLIGLTLALGALMYMNFTPGKPGSGAMLESPADAAKPGGRIEVRPGAKSDAAKSDAAKSDAKAESKPGARVETGPSSALDPGKSGPGKSDAAATAPAPGSAPIQPSGAMSPSPTPSVSSPAAAPTPSAAAGRGDPASTGTLGRGGAASGPRTLREAAAAGDAAAEYETGVRFLEGRGGVQKDAKAAAQWLERAAEKGLAPAQYRLGALYEKGVGAPRDLAQAKSWYQRAADAGNARAMHNLAVLTAEGAGDKPDYAAAAQLFGKAAEFGVRDSQYNLAILYARGLGVEQNLALSYAWFATAARQGDEDAGRKREEIAAKLDPKLLEDAKRTAELFRAKPLERAANEVAPPPGGWDKAESGAVPAPFGGVGVRPIGRPRAG